MIETRVVLDNETGVNYIFALNMMNGGITVTPLLDQTGEVYIENIDDER
ncbi:MAG: xylan 1,4-beta-xylosidase [Ruminiclostridium sp.]|nr:xylan 1,4-beta-xylosidase [Ruminiclostridium sp.]